MPAARPHGESDAEEIARRTADRLALALEDVGFDVGVAFPALRGLLDSNGVPAVELGQVSEPVAAHLATVLSDAARRGVAL